MIQIVTLRSCLSLLLELAGQALQHRLLTSRAAGGMPALVQPNRLAPELLCRDRHTRLTKRC